MDVYGTVRCFRKRHAQTRGLLSQTIRLGQLDIAAGRFDREQFVRGNLQSRNPCGGLKGELISDEIDADIHAHLGDAPTTGQPDISVGRDAAFGPQLRSWNLQRIGVVSACLEPAHLNVSAGRDSNIIGVLVREQFDRLQRYCAERMIEGERTIADLHTDDAQQASAALVHLHIASRFGGNTQCPDLSE